MSPEPFVAGFCFLAFLAGITWVGGLIVFAPMYETTLLFHVDAKFRISDALVLAILLHVALALLLAPTPMDQVATRGMIVMLALILVTFWWITGLRMLSRAGIDRSAHRWLFLGVIMPIGYLSVAVIAGSIVIIPGILEAIGRALAGHALSGVIAVGLMFLLGAAVIASYLCNLGSRELVMKARELQATRDGIEFDGYTDNSDNPGAPRRPYYPPKQLPAPSPEGIWLEEPILMARVAEPKERLKIDDLEEDGEDDESREEKGA